jgi:predicted transcriptional regulator
MRIIKGEWIKSKVPGPVALDILEIFAHNESLSTYQVFSKLSSTTEKMAYKNVHKIIQRLLALNLLTKAKRRKSNDIENFHNAIYYKLSELGIFRLFLTRHPGILVDRLSTMKVKEPIIKEDKEFIQHYGDCKIFEAFLLPVIRLESLRLLHQIFLLKIFDYLHVSCKAVEGILQMKDPNLPVTSTICSWNEMLEKQIIDISLLLSLRTKFMLDSIDLREYIDGTKIKLNPERIDELELLNTNAQFKIKMRLDKSKKKVIATHPRNRIIHNYEIEEIGSDILIVNIQPKIDWEIGIKFGRREQISSLVYQMVSTIGWTSQEQRSGLKELTRDETFNRLVEDVYAQFEQGRSVLLELKP